MCNNVRIAKKRQQIIERQNNDMEKCKHAVNYVRASAMCLLWIPNLAKLFSLSPPFSFGENIKKQATHADAPEHPSKRKHKTVL